MSSFIKCLSCRTVNSEILTPHAQEKKDFDKQSVVRHHHSSFAMVKTRLDKKLQKNAFSQGLVEIGYGLPRCLDFLMQGSFLAR